MRAFRREVERSVADSEQEVEETSTLELTLETT
jgi:hypothetical protein